MGSRTVWFAPVRVVARGGQPENTNDALASILKWRIIDTGGRVNRAEIDKIARFIAAGLSGQ